MHDNQYFCDVDLSGFLVRNGVKGFMLLRLLLGQKGLCNNTKTSSSHSSFECIMIDRLVYRVVVSNVNTNGSLDN